MMDEQRDLRERIAMAIFRAASDDNLRKLKEFGNAMPFADAVLAFVNPRADEGDWKDDMLGAAYQIIGILALGQCTTPPLTEILDIFAAPSPEGAERLLPFSVKVQGMDKQNVDGLAAATDHLGLLLETAQEQLGLIQRAIATPAAQPSQKGEGDE